MARYQFQARNAVGKIQLGQVEAGSESEAVLKIKSQNLMPLKIIVAPQSGGAGASVAGLFTPRVPSKDLQIFTRQFSTLINAGIPVVDSLRILSEGKRNLLLKEAAAKVKTSIEGGRRLGDAMSTMPLVFDKFYVNMVRAGEEAGILDNILNRLAIYLEKSEKIKKQVTGAMVYPSAIIIVAGLVITGILVFIIPKFQELYSASGKALPAITQMVVDLSHFLVTKWYIVIGGLFVTPYGLITYYRTDEGKTVFDRIFIRAPVIGDLVQKSSIARMSRTLSTLLSSGVGVVEALDIAAKTAGNKVIEDALFRSKESVIAGKPLAAPLGKEKNIPDMVVQMIAIGEESGQMDVMLGKIADFYEDDVENAVKAMTSLIEPLLMVFLGGSIAVLVTAMYLPIFDLANVTGGN